MSNTMPVIIQSILYRNYSTASGPEILLLKRSEERGGFWSHVNGTLEFTESAIQCREREVFEETGIRVIKSWSNEIHRFSFTRNDQLYVVISFAGEVSPDQAVTINYEHTEFKWVTVEVALKLLKFDDDKTGILMLMDTFKNHV